jgi:hypothetical protein
MTCPEVKLTGKSMEQRLADRRKNSGDVAHADHVVVGDKDMKTNIHLTRNQQYGDGERGLDIHGNKRGVV